MAASRAGHRAAAINSPTMQPRDLGGRNDCRSVRNYLPAIVNQVLQSMRRDVQGGGVHRIFVASRGLGALGLQDIVNFVFDGSEFGLGIGFPYPANQCIQCVQWTIVCEWRDSQKFPGRREDCCEAAQNHGRQIDPVPVLVHEALLGAVVEGSGAGMQGKIGIRIGAGSGNLRKDRLLDQEVPANVHDRLGQAGDQIGTELLQPDIMRFSAS